METVRLLVPLFTLIGLGYALRSFRVFPEDFGGNLGRLVYYVVLPALLFSAAKELDLQSLTGLSATVAYVVTIIVSIAAAVVVSLAFPLRQRGAFTQAAFRPNLAYMGLPITVQIFGDTALPIMALILSVGTVFHAAGTVVVLQLLRHDGGKPDIARLLKLVFTNPIVISVASGLLLSISGVQLPAIIDEPIQMLRRMSLPTVLITVGFSIDFHEIAKRLVPLTGVVLFKLFVMPVIGYLVFRFIFGGSGDPLIIMALACGMPTAIMAQSFASAMDADESLTAAAVSATTLLIFVSVPVLLALFRFLGGAI